jgi:hypothetical protein
MPLNPTTGQTLVDLSLHAGTGEHWVTSSLLVVQQRSTEDLLQGSEPQDNVGYILQAGHLEP